jgi:hypothetical protein
MARNRKGQSELVLLGPALKASVICLVIVIFCVGFVWEKRQIRDLSQQKANQELQLDNLRDTNKKLTRQLEGLKTTVALDARVRELKLGMVPPQQSQIWRLTEPVPDKVTAGRPQPMAVRDTALADTP